MQNCPKTPSSQRKHHTLYQMRTLCCAKCQSKPTLLKCIPFRPHLGGIPSQTKQMQTSNNAAYEYHLPCHRCYTAATAQCITPRFAIWLSFLTLLGFQANARKPLLVVATLQASVCGLNSFCFPLQKLAPLEPGTRCTASSSGLRHPKPPCHTGDPRHTAAWQNRSMAGRCARSHSVNGFFRKNQSQSGHLFSMGLTTKSWLAFRASYLKVWELREN